MRLRPLRLLILGVLFWITQPATFCLQPPRAPVIYSSWGGKTIVRAEPAEIKRDGTVAKNASVRVLAFDGRTKAYRSKSNFILDGKEIPNKLLVSDDGSRVVAVDWLIRKEDPVLTVYSGKGKVLRRFTIKDLLPESEFSKIPTHAFSPEITNWAQDAWLVRDDAFVTVTRARAVDSRHAEVTVDLKTFEVVDLPPLTP